MEKRGYKLQEFVAHSTDVNCVSIGKKSNRVFITGGEDRKVNLWAIGKPTPLLSLAGHTSSVDSVAFDTAEVLVLAGSSNGTIKLWDLEEAKIVRTLPGHRLNCTSVEFHPFGEFFASGSLDTDLKIWDIRKKGCIHTYKGHSRGIRTIKFTPDGRWVVTGGDDNVVKLWDLTAGKLLHDFKFHNGHIRCINFHPHEFLLATGSADRTVKFWDLETFELIGSSGPEATGVRSMIFHPDGRTLFCGLDMTLKVLSWEPVRYHDVVDMGWSTLADLSIYEGKLLGCSYRESRVGVWVADISLIGPYALGVLPKKNGLAEPIYSHVEDQYIRPPDSTAKSSSVLMSRHQSMESTITDECCQSGLQGISSIYKSTLTPTSSDGIKRNKSSLPCNSTPERAHSKISGKSFTIRSTTIKVVKATESSPSNRSELSSPSRVLSVNPSTARVNTSPSLKKSPRSDSRQFRNIEATAGPVSMPVIIPGDSVDLETSGNNRKESASTKCAVRDDKLCSSIHLRRQSFSGGVSGSESQLTATISEPFCNMNADSGVTDSNLHSRLTVCHKILEADEKNQTNIRDVSKKFESTMSLEQPLPNDKCTESPCSTTETAEVKYVRGVAVQLGRTRSLVESWERRDRCNSGYAATVSSSSEQGTGADCVIPLSRGHTYQKNLSSLDDGSILEILNQSHDVFINAVKSRLTKLQVVRHFFEQDGIKGAINAVAKLPDYSVGSR
ncbi:katanin p80 WD40 repeat-containing subunit B1 homolog isoform X2 [Ananas comosus]|uniref:Katanin p80 WD40 repeat-containing subunit B1 homolog n=1 Tax=Ananas comosus TaxID=4615 RepID=A0A6P5F5Q8_ANACO|nr:katanin p80 WD40 repeat-containing subunit B1 homolog isoform X2 [Ananas comosus]